MAPEKDIEKAVPAKAAGADKKPCLDRVLGSKHGVKIIAVGSCLVIAGAIIGVLYATCASGRRLRRNLSEAAGPRGRDRSTIAREERARRATLANARRSTRRASGPRLRRRRRQRRRHRGRRLSPPVLERVRRLGSSGGGASRARASTRAPPRILCDFLLHMHMLRRTRRRSAFGVASAFAPASDAEEDELPPAHLSPPPLPFAQGRSP